MNPLHRAQTEFQNYLLRRDGPIVADVVGDERVDAHGRLDIYADAYRLRLIEALEGDFVALQAYVGPERFDEIARAYIEAHPSEHFSLRYTASVWRVFWPIPRRTGTNRCWRNSRSSTGR
ncbi:MAG: DNA-binding domain-containing protein [Pseudomonadota bacterium]